MEEQHRKAVQALQQIADEDLASARVLLGTNPPLVRMAAFHAQQAVEKHLKAWLLALGEFEYPLSHNLLNLAGLLADRGGPTLPAEPLQFLTRFAVAPRYDVAHVTQDDAERALAEADRIVETARQAVAALLNEPKMPP